MTHAAVYEQAAFRWGYNYGPTLPIRESYPFYGTANDQEPLGIINRSWQANAGVYLLTLLIKNTGGVDGTIDPRIQYREGTGGTWTTLAGSGTDMKYTDSDIGNNLSTIQRIGSGTFSAGKTSDNANNQANVLIPSGEETELTFSITPDSAATDNTDYYFRVVDNTTALDTYTVLPKVKNYTNPDRTDTVHIRLRNDDGTESTATWAAAEDASADVTLDEQYRIRVSSQFQYKYSSSLYLMFRRNGGTWSQIHTNSTYVRAFSSTHFTHGDKLSTERLTSPTGNAVGAKFENGALSDQGNFATPADWLDPADSTYGEKQIGWDSWVELEFCLAFRSADNSAGDTFEFAIHYTGAGTPAGGPAPSGGTAAVFTAVAGSNTETIVATTTPVATVTRQLTASRSIVTVGTGVVDFVDKFFKTIAASTTPVAAFVRKKPKAISVITTPVAVVAKQANRFRSIVATSPGVAACSRNLTAFRTIVASTTPTAVVSGITKWFRAISATAGSTVLFAKAKQFTRAILATTTPTAVLSKIQMYKRTVAATTTGIATVVRASTLARTITVISTAAVLFTKRTLYDRAITVITTPVAVVNEVRSFLRTIAATTTPIAAFAKKTYHLIEVITTPVAAFDWKMFLTITASTTPTATVTNDAGGLVSRDIIASTTPVASVTKAPTFVRVFTASTTPIAVLAKKFYRALTIAATAGSTVVFTKEFVLQRTIAATSPGVATVARVLTAARTITASSAPVAVFNKTSSRFRTIAASSLGSALIIKGLLLHKTIVAVSTPVANVIKSFLNTAVISASSTPVVVFANVYKPKGGISDHRHQHIISPGPSRRFKM